MRRLAESVEVENLNHHIVNHCKKMAPMTEFNFITVFDGEVNFIHDPRASNPKYDPRAPNPSIEL